ncbi:RluA family pseudouridine synthase [Portibacter marinus]|uniref:RluA family pseudouridine synthase n=1 Tax=Portibacter marinus TaxID=2898660 RepID=UPI001F2D9EDB|nr:RNA pseudouridine synthase [Portibacter marinus]
MTKQSLDKTIIYQDSECLIVNKPAGSSAQDDHTDGQSIHAGLENFVHKPLYLVHRLDKPTSGVMLFAKRKKVAAYLNDLLSGQNEDFKKEYLAAVKNPPVPANGKLTHYLLHDKKQRKSLLAGSKSGKSKEAVLEYETLATSDHYTLLKIRIETGRFHQIRAQLSAIGSPIKGDVKYGARRSNKDRSIHLHAYSLQVYLGHKKIYAQAALPDDPVWNAFKSMHEELSQDKFELWKEEPTSTN